MVELKFDAEDAKKLVDGDWKLVRGVPCRVVDGEVRTVAEVLGLVAVRPKNGDWCDVRRENLIGESEVGGARGVYYDKRQNRYVAQVAVNGRPRYVGSAKTEAEALELFKERANEVRLRVIASEGERAGRSRALGKRKSDWGKSNI